MAAASVGEDARRPARARLGASVRTPPAGQRRRRPRRAPLLRLREHLRRLRRARSTERDDPLGAPDGTGFRIEARGLRNPFGLAVEPATGRIFVSVNNRDDLGTREPAEAIVVLRRGANYGWPGCWPSWAERRLPRLLRRRDRAACVPRAALVGERDGVPRRRAVRRRMGAVPLRALGAEGRARRPADGPRHAFADGFEHPLAVAADGPRALLVSDWGRGVVYRLSRMGAR